MNTNDMFLKIASGEELSNEEKKQVAKASISRKTSGNTFERILSGEEVSIEEKLEIARSLVADNVAEILKREMVISHLSGEYTAVNLGAKECRDSDENIRKFLTILGAKNIEVTSDFPGYNESYAGTTTIRFKY